MIKPLVLTPRTTQVMTSWVMKSRCSRFWFWALQDWKAAYCSLFAYRYHDILWKREKNIVIQKLDLEFDLDVSLRSSIWERPANLRFRCLAMESQVWNTADYQMLGNADKLQCSIPRTQRSVISSKAFRVFLLFKIQTEIPSPTSELFPSLSNSCFVPFFFTFNAFKCASVIQYSMFARHHDQQ